MRYRLIKTWTRWHECVKAREQCYECREKIAWGRYKREVFAVDDRRHPGLDVRVTHEVCPT